MRCIAAGCGWQTAAWQQQLENADEHCLCQTTASAQQALDVIAAGQTDAVILCGGDASQTLLDALSRQPPLHAVWLIGDDLADPRIDLTLSIQDAAALHVWWQNALDRGELPCMAQTYLPQLTGLAGSLLHVLDMPPRLGAWTFLPEMLALSAVCPQLLDAVSLRLYPLVGSHFGLSSACVERRLRLAVESTWNRADIDALDRFFGQSIDPMRGKPTNREFLCRMRERLYFDARRMVGGWCGGDQSSSSGSSIM